jgi:hypothetical protein
LAEGRISSAYRAMGSLDARHIAGDGLLGPMLR